ncbi:cysteine synthase A [Aliidiomarina haloalkalitolerans]|uniref:cysteine synthase n=1 Tax=Aliidiomarina haloalkalitolerans TaxID=859059 RepID=A0A432VTK6_9GAMM|nr:cysteine synthase A [Aliidiomarina haloalkalitolerans]MCL4409408.1 cysteine synthase A [Gammaproteobacteria bacterium]RUO19844.1 cysteine synthase A [Aliidiomarina haloalkalitolerans]
MVGLRRARSQAELIGNTDLLLIPSLSKLCGSNIYLKCEFQNPGGSIKDRAALQLVQDAMERGELKPGMTIVEGTAGNTGIGLAVVAQSLGFDLLVVMPNDQTPEKTRMIELHGGRLMTVPPVPFRDENHFYHTARRLAEENPNYWWANQFENISNMRAHYLQTGPEIWQQTDGAIDILVSVAGTGGTLAGNSKFLKEQKPELEVWMIDPDGSGVYEFLLSGEYRATGGSMTEGIGIMRLVENFRHAKIDYALNLPDQDLVSIAAYVREQDGIVLGSSSALNVAGALFAALQHEPGKTIVTFACDLGERSISKLYNPEYLRSRDLNPEPEPIDALKERYRAARSRALKVERRDWQVN